MSGRRLLATPVDPNDSKVQSETSFLLTLNLNYVALATGASLSGSGGSKRKLHVVGLFVCLFVCQSKF
jgi:hypothetical protein